MKFSILAFALFIILIPATAFAVSDSHGNINILSYGAVSGQDCTSAIQNAINAAQKGETVIIPPGNYYTNLLYLKSDINLAGKGKLILNPGQTQLLHIEHVQNIVVDGIELFGGDTNYTWTTSEGNRIGVYMYNSSNINIRNSSITGFNKMGVYVEKTGNTLYGDSFKISHSRLLNNYYNLYLGKTAEYCLISNITANLGKVGIVVTGGNNQIVNSQFNNNVDGVWITSGPNHGHGNFTGNTINHNQRYSIFADSVTYGETFNGNDIYYGTLYLKKSKGIQILNGHIGSGELKMENGGYNLIKDNMISDLVVTRINDGSVLENNRRISDGQIIQ